MTQPWVRHLSSERQPINRSLVSNTPYPLSKTQAQWSCLCPIENPSHFLWYKIKFLCTLGKTIQNLANPTSPISPLSSPPTFTQCSSHIKLLLGPSHTLCICINCSFNLEFLFYLFSHWFSLLGSQDSLWEGSCSSSVCHVNIIYIFICFPPSSDLKPFEVQTVSLNLSNACASIVTENSRHP